MFDVLPLPLSVYHCLVVVLHLRTAGPTIEGEESVPHTVCVFIFPVPGPGHTIAIFDSIT